MYNSMFTAAGMKKKTHQNGKRLINTQLKINRPLFEELVPLMN